MLFRGKFGGRTEARESFELDDRFNGAGEDELVATAKYVVRCNGSDDVVVAVDFDQKQTF